MKYPVGTSVGLSYVSSAHSVHSGEHRSSIWVVVVVVVEVKVEIDVTPVVSHFITGGPQMVEQDCPFPRFISPPRVVVAVAVAATTQTILQLLTVRGVHEEDDVDVERVVVD